MGWGDKSGMVKMGVGGWGGGAGGRDKEQSDKNGVKVA